MAKLKDDKKINVEKVNDMVAVGDKILRILYALIIILAIYVIVLILREFNILPVILTLLKVISPLFIGWLLAWLLNPLVVKLTNKGLSRALSVIIVFAGLVLFIYLFFLFLIPTLGTQINDIVATIPNVITYLTDWFNEIFSKIQAKGIVNVEMIKTEFFGYIENMATNIATDLPKTAIGIITGFFSGIGTILIGFIVGFYMLFNFHKLRGHFLNLIPKKIKKDTAKLLDRISYVMYDYVKGTFVIACILFLVSYIGFAIIGLKAPALFALFCAITNLIPYIGPYIGGAAAALVGFTQSSFVGILVVIFIVIIQLLESNILQPVVMSKRMNLHPVTIVISLLIFGYFFGIIGMILATPITAFIKIIYVFLDEKYNFFEYKEDEEIIKSDKKKLVE